MSAGNLKTPLSLATICMGKLEEDFQELYPRLLASLKHGSKASVSIKIEFQRVAETETMVNTNYSIKPNFPAKSKASICQITDGFKLKTDEVPQKTNLSLLRKEEKASGN